MLKYIHEIVTGYLSTPVDMDTVKEITNFDDWVQTNETYGWDEYSVGNGIYPEFLILLADKGLAFHWEYQLTEDFSYYAYNFPTEESKNNLFAFKTGDKHRLPRISKKRLRSIESTSAANELVLLTLGNKNGSN